MFYSHEILTSPEHGVATIWLVATLGSRSIARRLNRKAIQDVDVPNACRVIINPEVPMALRLQGSLLYGVSHVYNQQCGYTLLDTQAMHDKMVSMLKIVPGSSIDPSAGQTKPNNLILPYDTSFLPETNLPGLDIDLSHFAPVNDSDQFNGLFSKSPVNSLSGTSQLSSLQLELPSDDTGEGTLVGLGENRGSAKKDIFAQVTGLGLGDEEGGLLLGADFTFDGDGNLVELEGREKTPFLSHKSPAAGDSEGVFDGRYNEHGHLRNDQVPIDTQTVVNVENDRMEIDTHAAGPTLLGEKDGQNVIEESIEIPRVRIPRVKRPKEITSDDTTALRNITLAQWNNEYLTNMVQALNQKQQNKVPTIAKKNAAFWVFGQGIGSVGLGLGMEQESHPLNIFSGEDLFESIGGYGEHSGQKHTRTEDDFDSEGRRVRAREEQAEHLSCENIDRLSMDVELGRDAPSSLFDDHSSQMPWNITASIKSSHRPHRFGSVSELSSQGRKARSRLTSASPLASRYGGQDRLSLDLGDFGDDLDLTRYLEGELATDREGISSISPGKRSLLEQAKASLDRESLNFFDFMKTKMGVEKSAQSPRSNDSPWTVSANGGRTTFATLMPPESTTRAVATQALMNVLTLATKGLLRVYQDQCSAEWGGYRSGEIQLRFSEM